jgi:predicted flap endonuclease-1-like 5' DNA nuclease/predicted  nucleic acid-binding Zn-ribbon protein
MPELTVIHIGLLAVMLVIGVVVGWMVRADRCAREKMAVSASWQDQLGSQQSEHGRLAEQNKSLMEQISQYQASQKDYGNRAKELSDSLKEAFARRDELQRQLKDMRGNLEVAIAQRDRLRSNLQNVPDRQGQAASLREKDDKIFHLSRELTSWQSRVPPLVERFQERDKRARELEAELESAQKRLQALEDLVKSDQTRIEPLDADSLPDGGDASNEPNAMTSAHDTSGLQDQIDDSQGDVPQEDVISLGEFDDPTDAGAGQNQLVGDAEFGDVFSGVAESARVELVSAEAEAGSADDGEVLETDVSSLDDEELEVEVGVLDAASGNPDDDAANEGDKDDLKTIKGVGPSIEKTLNELGIYCFHQIAEMSEYDIDRVAQQLKGFRSRIYREDWIGQARDLQYQKNNDRS